ncbi:MAG: hypothetical protein U0Z44_16795 [Kouleothrix sp.]
MIVTSDQPDKYRAIRAGRRGVRIWHRDHVTQRVLPRQPVTALIPDQTCATAERRRRKRNRAPDQPRACLSTRRCAKAAATAAPSRTA